MSHKCILASAYKLFYLSMQMYANCIKNRMDVKMLQTEAPNYLPLLNAVTSQAGTIYWECWKNVHDNFPEPRMMPLHVCPRCSNSKKKLLFAYDNLYSICSRLVYMFLPIQDADGCAWWCDLGDVRHSHVWNFQGSWNVVKHMGMGWRLTAPSAGPCRSSLTAASRRIRDPQTKTVRMTTADMHETVLRGLNRSLSEASALKRDKAQSPVNRS